MQHLVVTGSSGFVGRRLVEVAQGRGFNVIGLDQSISELVTCQQFAVNLNSDDLSGLIPEGASVVHLASLSTDPQCKENPVLAVESNLAGTIRILLSSGKAQASQFIFASSEWVYPETDMAVPLFESDSLDLLDLKSIYAISKLVAESLIRSTSDIPYWLLRFGIVYGPRKVPGSAPESLAYKVSRGEAIQVGSLNTGRCFIYIDDLIEGILSAVAAGPKKSSPIPVNVAGSQLVSLKHVVETAGKLLDLPIYCSEGKSSPSIRKPDISRAKEILNWEPRVSFDEGLMKCLSFMQEK